MKKQEQGYVLISVIIAVSLVLLTLLVASTYTQLGSRLLMLQLNYQGQALNTAQAGLVEGLDWFRRQTSQPVGTFNPKHDLTVPTNDTDVPSTCVAPGCTQTTPVSIQRDFLISAPGRVWGHYEVVIGNAGAGTGVLDLTQNRRPGAMAGSIWQLESTGVIYVRNDPNTDVRYNQAPNQVLATKLVRSEIQKIAVHLPDTAGLSINASGSNVSIGTTNNQARVVGGQNGRGVCSLNNNSPAIGGGATLSGNPPYQGPPALGASAFAITSVFGVTNQTDLATIADINVNSVAALPPTLPPMQLIILNVGAGNTAVFNSARPLQGSGILIVFGNLSINSGPVPSSWNGVIYVSGTYDQHEPSTINGSIVVAGNTATINGSGDFAEVFWDPFMLTQVQQQLSQYRFSRSGYVPCPSWDTNCNSRFAGS